MGAYRPLWMRPGDQKLLLDVLAQYGIDGRTVPENGVEREGYYTFVRGEDGKRLMRGPDGDVIWEFHPWPEGFPVETFLSIHNPFTTHPWV